MLWPDFNPITQLTNPWAKTLVLFLLFCHGGSLSFLTSHPGRRQSQLSRLLPVGVFSQGSEPGSLPPTPSGKPGGSTRAPCHQLNFKSIQYLWVGLSTRSLRARRPCIHFLFPRAGFLIFLLLRGSDHKGGIFFYVSS